MCKEYNGHKNYETWNVSLWIDNDPGLYAEIEALTEAHLEDADPETANVNGLADQIKEIISDMNPVGNEASMWSDLMGAALDNVSWYDIAEGWLETVHENNQ